MLGHRGAWGSDAAWKHCSLPFFLLLQLLGNTIARRWDSFSSTVSNNNRWRTQSVRSLQGSGNQDASTGFQSDDLQECSQFTQMRKVEAFFSKVAKFVIPSFSEERECNWETDAVKIMTTKSKSPHVADNSLLYIIHCSLRRRVRGLCFQTPMPKNSKIKEAMSLSIAFVSKAVELVIVRIQVQPKNA